MWRVDAVQRVLDPRFQLIASLSVVLAFVERFAIVWPLWMSSIRHIQPMRTTKRHWRMVVDAEDALDGDPNSQSDPGNRYRMVVTVGAAVAMVTPMTAMQPAVLSLSAVQKPRPPHLPHQEKGPLDTSACKQERNSTTDACCH